ncbi:FecR domain-containing protein [Pseudoalteromonas ostreae]|uniref:FecR domain-containing protein n=1 Tax=Pseudoalteromonas ostreae TaxID=2774154 RepID=UPI001B36BCE3|nr:FecR domain-containing protein [Pseudoalteromonas ostreae]
MAKISPDTIQQAAVWMARLWADDVNQQDKRAFQAWYDAEPEHAIAWQQLERLQEAFHKAPQSELSRAVLTHKKKGLSRRQLLVLGLFSLTNLGLIFAGRASQPRGREYITAVGELKTVTLSDGTIMTMNTDTRVYVDFDQSVRRLHLLQGEISVSSARHTASLYVTTRDGKAVPIGTRFTVKQQEHHTLVAVYEGVVELRPEQSVQLLRLKATQQAAFNPNSIMPIQHLFTTKPLWLEHKIQANGSKLTDFIADLARYRRGVISVEPQLAKYKVTGTFSTSDTDKTLQHLSEILPIEIHYRLPFWLSIKERG